jgi:hypothetical protein
MPDANFSPEELRRRCRQWVSVKEHDGLDGYDSIYDTACLELPPTRKRMATGRPARTVPTTPKKRGRPAGSKNKKPAKRKPAKGKRAAQAKAPVRKTRSQTSSEEESSASEQEAMELESEGEESEGGESEGGDSEGGELEANSSGGGNSDNSDDEPLIAKGV